jgi:hypothetical protein
MRYVHTIKLKLIHILFRNKISYCDSEFKIPILENGNICGLLLASDLVAYICINI